MMDDDVGYPRRIQHRGVRSTPMARARYASGMSTGRPVPLIAAKHYTAKLAEADRALGDAVAGLLTSERS